MDFSSILNFLFTAVLGVSIYFIKKQFEKIDALEETIHEIKYNYLNRFEEIKELISDVREQLSRLDERSHKNK